MLFIAIDEYIINDYTYFELRDLAMVLMEQTNNFKYL